MGGGGGGGFQKWFTFENRIEYFKTAGIRDGFAQIKVRKRVEFQDEKSCGIVSTLRLKV